MLYIIFLFLFIDSKIIQKGRNFAILERKDQNSINKYKSTSDKLFGKTKNEIIKILGTPLLLPNIKNTFYYPSGLLKLTFLKKKSSNNLLLRIEFDNNDCAISVNFIEIKTKYKKSIKVVNPPKKSNIIKKRSKFNLLDKLNTNGSKK